MDFHPEIEKEKKLINALRELNSFDVFIPPLKGSYKYWFFFRIEELRNIKFIFEIFSTYECGKNTYHWKSTQAEAQSV